MVHVPPLCMVDRWTISILLLEIPRLQYDAEYESPVGQVIRLELCILEII